MVPDLAIHNSAIKKDRVQGVARRSFELDSSASDVDSGKWARPFSFRFFQTLSVFNDAAESCGRKVVANVLSSRKKVRMKAIAEARAAP